MAKKPRLRRSAGSRTALDVLRAGFRKPSEQAVADDIASAAGLVMRKTARSPVVVVRGLEAQGDGRGRDLIRPAAEDVFR